MRALVGLLLLSIALSVLSRLPARAQELGRCEPTKAVKVIDGAVSEKEKHSSKPWRMMIKAKVFDGSKGMHHIHP